MLYHEWNDSVFQPYRDAFPEEARKSPAAFQRHVKDLMAKDVKISYLKSLQGTCHTNRRTYRSNGIIAAEWICAEPVLHPIQARHLNRYLVIEYISGSEAKESQPGYLWIKGYQNGDYTAPLFPDVAPQLKAWHAAGKSLAIFSSGSVDAQKLFFQYTGTGEARSATEDLNYLITDYFDTVNAGPKTERQSYVKIAEKLGKKCEDVLFLSDNVNGRSLFSTSDCAWKLTKHLSQRSAPRFR